MTDPDFRAEWQLADLMRSTAEPDPFGPVIYSTGIKLNLSESVEELGELCIKLLMREERLFKRGMTCKWKDGGQDCLTCPHATLDRQEARSVLCRLGKDQGTIEGRYTEMNKKRLADLHEFVDEYDAESELGHLPDELGELLTQVGL